MKYLFQLLWQVFMNDYNSLDEFSDMLKQNRVLNNGSNSLKKIVFRKITATKEIKLLSQDYITYGYLSVTVENPQNLEIYYNDVKLAKFTKSETRIIYCVFEDNPTLKISGTSGQLSIEIYGADSTYQNLIKCCAGTKKLVFDCGKNEVYSYSTSDDISNNNLTFDESIEDMVDYGDCYYDTDTYNHAVLKNINDNLYLYMYTNDNTMVKQITSTVEHAKIITRDYLNLLSVAYIRGQKVYYKSITTSGVSDEIEIPLDTKFYPKSICEISISGTFPLPIIGIASYDGKIALAYLSNDSAELLTDKNGQNAKIFVTGNKVDIAVINDYNVIISKYLCTNYSLTQQGENTTIWNVNDIVKIDDKYLLFNNKELSGTINYDDI